MGKTQLTEREKELLNILGKDPCISMKELTTRSQYMRLSSIVRKIDQFKRENILYGPFYDIDYGKLCKNSIHLLTCIVEHNISHKTVISYFKLIEPLRWVYPVLSPRKEFLSVIFLSSNDQEMKALLTTLKENTIITDYVIRPHSHMRIQENPNFFGDINPSLHNLLDPCVTPDICQDVHDTDWNECNIAMLPYLHMGYKSARLIEILKAEKNLGRTWTYEQVKYSHQKMLENGLIRKNYTIYPFPIDQCLDFNLFLKTDDTNLTQRIICNFAEGARIGRDYILCGDWGYVGFASHPQFLTGLMDKLDKIDVIKEKEIYQFRSIPSGKYYFVQSPTLKYFNFDEQTLEYPYHIYKEKIKEKIENEGNRKGLI